MADNLSVEAPQFDLIQKETGIQTRAAINLLWTTLNYEIAQRRTGVRGAMQHGQPKVLSIALGGDVNDYDLTGAGVLLLTSASAHNITGFKAPGPGQSYEVLVMVIGAGTHTMKFASGSSLAANRFRMQSGADVAIATDKCMRFSYLNSLWREEKFA